MNKILEDTGGLAEVAPDMREDVDGGSGSYALDDGGDDAEFTALILENPGEVWGGEEEDE